MPFCWIFIRRHEGFGSKYFTETTSGGDSDTSGPLRPGYSSLNATLLSSSLENERLRLSEEKTCTKYYIPPSAIKQAWEEEMSERLPEAALVCLTLICTDEPFWLWPGNHQPAPALSVQPLMKEVQIRSRCTLMLPPHIRRLSVWQQEAITQIYVQKTKGNLNVF